MTNFQFNKYISGLARFISAMTILTLLMVPATVRAGILGETGTSFTLSASEGYISIADGGSVYSWGYKSSQTAGDMQLPGPTLIVTAGSTVTVTLNNDLPTAAGNTSIVFPGHDVSAIGGVAGGLAQEAPVGGSVQYTFTAGEPGTYQYHSGSQPDLQVEMGLYGAIIVRPTPGQVAAALCTGGTVGLPLTPAAAAYAHPETCYDREYLFLLSEIDLDIHQAAEQQAGGPGPIILPADAYRSEYFLLNGRAAPDTMAAAGDGLLVNQPYNSFPRMHPGERLLLRVVGAGRQSHPFHTHGNHAQVLARDGRLLTSATDASKLAGPELFTIPSVPGQTVDAIFHWTGKDLGWDVYGTTDINPHDCDTPGGTHSVASDPNFGEWCPDHDRAIPVKLPSLSSLAFGGFYGGSPYLGAMGSLPPGEGGLNPDAGYAYMWHSHNAIEQVNNDVFPGGMMTMLIIEAPSVAIND